MPRKSIGKDAIVSEILRNPRTLCPASYGYIIEAAPLDGGSHDIHPTGSIESSFATAPGGITMLVLTRRIGEEIVIGEKIRVILVEVLPGRVRLGVVAPASVTVDREEVHERRRRESPMAVSDGKAIAS
jgi:carbon storage regulator